MHHARRQWQLQARTSTLDDNGRRLDGRAFCQQLAAHWSSYGRHMPRSSSAPYPACHFPLAFKTFLLYDARLEHAVTDMQHSHFFLSLDFCGEAWARVGKVPGMGGSVWRKQGRRNGKVVWFGAFRPATRPNRKRPSRCSIAHRASHSAPGSFGNPLPSRTGLPPLLQQFAPSRKGVSLRAVRGKVGQPRGPSESWRKAGICDPPLLTVSSRCHLDPPGCLPSRALLFWLALPGWLLYPGSPPGPLGCRLPGGYCVKHLSRRICDFHH